MKLITKIVGATLGLAMAIGVSVGAASNRQQAKPVYATEQTATYNINSLEWGEWTSVTPLNYNTTGNSAKYGRNSAGTSTAISPSSYSNITTFVFSGSKSTSGAGSCELFWSATSAVDGTWTSLGSKSFNNTLTWSNLSVSGYLKFNFVNTKGNTYVSSLAVTYEGGSSKTNTSIALTSNKSRIDLNETAQLTAVVKDEGDSVVSEASVSFSSNNTSVANVDSNGLITASSSNYGVAIITASYAGDSTYNSSEATFKIRVCNPESRIFNIADIASANSWSNGTAYGSLNTIDNVTITGSGTGDNKKYYSSGNGTWRFYSSGSGTITISTSIGYLKKITLKTEGTSYFTTAPSNWSYSDNLFTASNKTQTSVTLSNGSGQSRIEEIEVLLGQAYTVTYDANGGSGTMTDSNSPYDKGTTVTVLENAFTAPSKKVFDHWNTAANNSGANYSAGNTFAANANTTLYAQWVDAGNDPYVEGVNDTITGVYSASSMPISFTYGNFENDMSISSSNTSVLTVTNIDTDDEDNSSATLNFVAGGSANLLFKDGEDVVKSVAVTVTASSVTITGLPSSEDCYMGIPLDLGSTITVTHIGSYSEDVSWESDAESVATVDENGVVTPVSIGSANITVTSDDYSAATMTCSVSVSYKNFKLETASSIAVGDVVYLASNGASKQINGIAGGNTKYATGASFNGEPNRETYALKVEAGSEENTYAFKIMAGDDADNYLYWGSGNSLNITTTLNSNSSWKVSFDASNNATIKNAADDTRVIWWNVSDTRFASYVDKTDGASFKYVQLWKLSTPEQYLKSSTAVATTQDNIIRFGSSVSQEAWNAINSDWPITNYGVMFYKTDSLEGLPENPVETAYRAGVVAPKIVAKGSGVAPSPVDGKYTFTARVKVDNNDTIFCAASFIVAGGRYYFFNEVQKSANSLV